MQIWNEKMNEKIYKKIIEISNELINAGLTGWETELIITDKKKKKTEVKVIFKLKELKKCLKEI
jgi:hypothetical protein